LLVIVVVLVLDLGLFEDEGDRKLKKNITIEDSGPRKQVSQQGVQTKKSRP
jgi:hypothetical protein